MTLFDESDTAAPARAPRLARGTAVGLWAFIVALVALVVLTFMPTGFVIEQPGPVYDTIGTTVGEEGAEVPLIEVSDAETYKTAGSLDLTTVQVVGNRERTPSWFEVATAWFDPARAVVPIESVFPEGVTSEQRDEQNAAMMVDSQSEATAAALTKVGYDVPTDLVVASVPKDSPAEGELRQDDRIVAAGGEKVASLDGLREAIQTTDGDPIEITVSRGGAEQTVPVTPERTEIEGKKAWAIGVGLRMDYHFPIDVKIRLDDVGGPSAGLMFALGIIDVLTPGELNGGAEVAGTGTIDAAGTVGPIGGIRQKLYAARGEGADYFLAPTDNCAEVAGNVPAGLHVIEVATLDDAIDALGVIAADGDVAALPDCTGSPDAVAGNGT